MPVQCAPRFDSTAITPGAIIADRAKTRATLAELGRLISRANGPSARYNSDQAPRLTGRRPGRAALIRLARRALTAPCARNRHEPAPTRWGETGPDPASGGRRPCRTGRTYPPLPSVHIAAGWGDAMRPRAGASHER